MQIFEPLYATSPRSVINTMAVLQIFDLAEIKSRIPFAVDEFSRTMISEISYIFNDLHVYLFFDLRKVAGELLVISHNGGKNTPIGVFLCVNVFLPLGYLSL